MNLSLLVALVEDERTDQIVQAARDAGATGATILSSVRGEGMEPQKTFLGLTVTSHRDMILFLVARSRARVILEEIAKAGDFEGTPGSGVAFELHIADAVGLGSQMEKILSEVARDI